MWPAQARCVPLLALTPCRRDYSLVTCRTAADRDRARGAVVTRVWFITGTSRGFGRVWTQAALERGDSVAATARDTHTLDDLAAAHGERLLPLELDVTDKAGIEESVRSAHEHFGRLDVVVNNAGYGQFGAIEELTEHEARRQIETNLSHCGS